LDDMSLKVAPTLAPRLAEHVRRVSGDARASGWLVGPASTPPGEIVILGSICRARECSDAGADLARGAALLPGGLAVVGAYVSGDKAAAEALVAEVKPHLDGGFALASIAADGAASFYHRFSTSDAVVALEATELEPGWLEREYALFRCAMRVPIGTDNSAGVDAALAAAEAEARSDATILVVHLHGERGDEEDEEDDESAPTEKRKTGGGGGGGGKKGKKGGKKSKGKSGGGGGGGGGSNADVATPARDRVAAGAGGRTDALLVGDLLPPPTDPTAAHRVVQMTPHARTSPVSVESSATPLPAPGFAFRPDEDGWSATTNATRGTARFSNGGSAFARVDALAYVPRATATFADAAAVMRAELATRCVAAAACAHLAEVSSTATSGTTGGSGREPACLHFSPPGVGHAVTVAYPLPPGERSASSAVEPDAGLASVREALHWALCLPMDRPALRVGNALDVGSSSDQSEKSSERLRDVHAIPPGLPASHVVGGTAHCVRGSYDYYHYMQDRFDDDGWGCAYRSLQTLCSWFRLQHYTSAPVPTHREIQACLCRIGDKPASFVGSKQWIGAIELSYVLDELLGMTCKIMTVQSGHDLPSRGRELARHFDVVGTPIMMGGGQLAYTLLGVDYNELTGECAFLILDPHYTGGEDVKSVVPRWCGWKKCEDVFVREFYNLLMPQPPTGV
jgi:hypothetical protein